MNGYKIRFKWEGKWYEFDKEELILKALEEYGSLLSKHSLLVEIKIGKEDE